MLEARCLGEWERWLKRNHLRNREVWLVYRKGKAGSASVSYEESLQAALVFGWVDSLVKRIDAVTYARKFTPRKPRSVWSRSNINRVEVLKAKGKMTRWGLKISNARTGEMSPAEKFGNMNLEFPDDLREGLRQDRVALTNFEHLSLSRQRRYLMWIAAAKRSETRQKRVEEAVELISMNVKDLK
jgi:uncharacterized protein YdeI (YjbR/CyaY-like superfamily)